MKAERLTDTVTLYEADCLDVLPTLEPGSVDAVITDPPYGISFQSAWRIESERFDEIANDDQPFVWWLPHAVRLLKPSGCLVCFCRWDTAEQFRLCIEMAGLKIGAQLVWDRIGHGMGDPSSRPSPQHDLMWFAVKGKYKLPGNRPTSVYRHQRISGNSLRHPNEKPLPLMRQLIRDYVPDYGAILEPFGGSGSTPVAAMLEGRNCVTVELDAGHCDTIRRRVRECDQTAPGTLFAHLPDLFTEAQPHA
jgi:DNA modification methylase